MVTYATPSDLAAFLQKDVDTSTATLVLTKMTALFNARSRSYWGGTLSTTYSKPGNGATEIIMPFAPLVAVSQVRIDGVVIAQGIGGYINIEQSLYRQMGFGIPWRFPPQLVEVDYTYGYPVVTDDVAGAILESAGAAYMAPDVSLSSESIDDYSVRYNTKTGGMTLSESAKELADWYAGSLVG